MSYHLSLNTQMGVGLATTLATAFSLPAPRRLDFGFILTYEDFSQWQKAALDVDDLFRTGQLVSYDQHKLAMYVALMTHTYISTMVDSEASEEAFQKKFIFFFG